LSPATGISKNSSRLLLAIHRNSAPLQQRIGTIFGLFNDAALAFKLTEFAVDIELGVAQVQRFSSYFCMLGNLSAKVIIND